MLREVTKKPFHALATLTTFRECIKIRNKYHTWLWGGIAFRIRFIFNYLQMGKLIELLNEFEENRPMELTRQYRRKEMPTFKWWLVAISEYDDEMVDNSDLLVISKFNWFIKWLVENDKIDRERINDRWWDMSVHFTDEELFIMSLSISNTPIDFLCEILR